MTLKTNIQGTGASYGHSDAVCGELAPYVIAAGSNQASATLLRRMTRHIVTGGTGGVAIPPGVGAGDQLQDGDELEITNASGVTINVYPPLGVAFLGSSANAAVTLVNGYSLSVMVDSATRLIPRYYAIASGSGNVSSVGLALPASIMSVSGSPVTTSGTLTGSLTTQTANTVWAGPTTGAPATPTFRALVAADLPIGLGTVSSVGLSLPTEFTVSGSPVTTAGTLTAVWKSESQNLCFASPNGSSGTPAFRALVLADLPATVVSTTGSPANGNLTKFTGAATVSNGDLSGDVTTSGSLVTTLKANLKKATIYYEISGGGSTITTGLKGYMQIDFDCTITANTVLLDQSGSIIINIWKCTYAQFDAGSTHPVAGDKITASAPPTVAATTKSTDSTLTGWTTSISAGDILAFNVDSITTATRAELMLTVTKT